MAAWELVKSEESSGSLELAVVNPTLVVGPSLSKNMGTSIDICSQILTGKMMFTPHICMNVVDVRDVAEGIVRAMVRHNLSLRVHNAKRSSDRRGRGRCIALVLGCRQSLQGAVVREFSTCLKN